MRWTVSSVSEALSEIQSRLLVGLLVGLAFVLSAIAQNDKPAATEPFTRPAGPFAHRSFDKRLVRGHDRKDAARALLGLLALLSAQSCRAGAKARSRNNHRLHARVFRQVLARPK
jgi:hypothetical protein